MKNVAVSTEFLKQQRKILSAEQNNRVERVWAELAAGVRKGKCLGPPWLWQVKLGEKRAYFALSDTAVLFINISDKGTQQATINRIRIGSGEWKEELDRLSGHE